MVGDKISKSDTRTREYTEKERNEIRQKMTTAAAEIANEERSCRVGDLLHVIAPFEVNDWDGNSVLVVASGQVYKAVSLFGRGWDLELISGSGPNEVRVIDSDIPNFFKVVASQL